MFLESCDRGNDHASQLAQRLRCRAKWRIPERATTRTDRCTNGDSHPSLAEVSIQSTSKVEVLGLLHIRHHHVLHGMLCNVPLSSYSEAPGAGPLQGSPNTMTLGSPYMKSSSSPCIPWQPSTTPRNQQDASQRVSTRVLYNL